MSNEIQIGDLVYAERFMAMGGFTPEISKAINGAD